MHFKHLASDCVHVRYLAIPSLRTTVSVLYFSQDKNEAQLTDHI